MTLYGRDLAYIHDAGFSGVAQRAAPGLVRLLTRHGIREGRIAEYGCGGGHLAQALIEAGYDVTGIDVSPAMIRLARARAPEATFRAGSLTDDDVPRCRAIVAIGEVVSYVREPRREPRQLARFFASAFTALEPRGLLVFDFIESAMGRTGSGDSSGDDWAVEWRTTASRSGRVLCRHIVTTRRAGGRTRRNIEIHRVRVYEREVIAETLRACGFRVAMRRSYGTARLPPGDAVCVAEKPGRPPSGTRIR